MEYIVAIFNLAVIAIISTAAYPVVGITLTIISVFVTFVLPYFTVGNFVIVYCLKRGNISPANLDKQQKSLYLSLAMYTVVFKIAGAIGAFVTFGAIGLLALAIWLATGWWWDGGLSGVLNATVIAKWAVNIYQLITSVGEKIITGIVDVEMQALGVKE